MGMCVGPSCLFLILDIFSVVKVMNIFKKLQFYHVQNINRDLFSSLPNLKINISRDINYMLAHNIHGIGVFLIFLSFVIM